MADVATQPPGIRAPAVQAVKPTRTLETDSTHTGPSYMKPHYLILSALVWVCLRLHAADLTGQWKAEFDTQVGKQNYTYDLKAEGDKVTGKATGDINGQNKRTVDLQEVSLAGDRKSVV